MTHEPSAISADLFTYAQARSFVDSDAPAVRGWDETLRLLKAGFIEQGPRFALKAEAWLLQLAYAHNKILSLSNSRTRILAHQVESTHRIVNALNHRFLIADEVGLGKTIEAGLVIKELAYRHGYDRILITCPASLCNQWQAEMATKFNDHFLIMDRALMRKAKTMCPNPWKAYDRIICSIDFIKNSAFAEDLRHTKWDSVVFDESHRLRRDSRHGTQAYAAAEIIARNARALLLLSATPFRGNLEELYFIIALIDPNLLGPFHSFYSRYCLDEADLSSLRRRLSQVVIRRTKKEIGGFTQRRARTIRFELHPDERRLYDETTRYVSEEYNRAMQLENRAVGFVMTIFQKLLDSSSHALLCAFTRRIDKLTRQLQENGKPCLTRDLGALQDEELIHEQEEPDEVLSAYAKKTADEVREEIRILQRLAGLAEQIEANKKGEKLRELVAGLKEKGHDKFLIFTQFRTTQDYLAELLSDYRVAIFNGTMSRDEKEEAVLRFRDEAEVFICTEAGGEGRNLQFCHILVNYDLPWSPLKIEQRIGRIHRFGQKHDVSVYNFSTRDTVAERVLEVLQNKLKLFEESIGTPDVMLGPIEDELNLSSLFMEMATGRKTRKSTERELDERIELARRNYEKLSELTIAEHLDFNYDEYYKITLAERKFSNRRIESFVGRLQSADQGVLSEIGRRNGKSGLYSLPSKDGKKSFGTFDSEKALKDESLDFLAFGHPVVDGLIRRCQAADFGGRTGIRMIAGGESFVLPLFYYHVTFEGAARTSELIPVVAGGAPGVCGLDYDDIERELVGQEAESTVCADGHREEIRIILDGIEDHARASLERLRDKIAARIRVLSDELDLTIDPELDKIKASYASRLRELGDKLELLEARMKWESKDLRALVTRTRNSIRKTEMERDDLIARYKSYAGVKYRVELVSAGVVIGTGPSTPDF